MRRILLVLLLLPCPVQAQNGGAYRDPVARQLVERARASRGELGADISSYTAVIRNRMAAQLRMPLKDRTLIRTESAARVRWSRDGETVVWMLAGREQDPGGVEPRTSTGQIFDPTSDRIYLENSEGKKDDGDLFIYHPLGADAEEGYVFSSGDTLRMRLPDGTTIRAIELKVEPRKPSYQYVAGALWIEPESGALVQALFRPSRRFDLLRDGLIEADDAEVLEKIPGIFKPMEGDLELFVIEYSLVELKHWMPRLIRVEGYVRAGAAKVPFGAETSYDFESVQVDGNAASSMTTPEVLASWGLTDTVRARISGGKNKRVVTYRPADEQALLSSPELPPAIWEASPEFATEAELEELGRRLEKLVPTRSRGEVTRSFDWGWGGTGLLRYNRVESLSVGARYGASHPLAAAAATVRLGAADLQPNIELEAQYRMPRRTLGLDLYHRLSSVDPDQGSLGFGNSAAALLLGRDDGEYFRATGARLSLAPAAMSRPWYRASLYGERHRAAERETDVSLAHLIGGDGFRPNIEAAAVELAGASLALTPWFGADARRVQGGLEVAADAVTGDRTFQRLRATARAAAPLFSGVRLGLEAGAGTTWGDAPIQYHWFMGGPSTLRGYDGSSAVGTSFGRGRVDFTRGTQFGALAIFSDAAWAGERSEFDRDDLLISAGVGGSLMDGLVRLDIARALREPKGWRLELYLDALL